MNQDENDVNDEAADKYINEIEARIGGGGGNVIFNF
jgi:hypothetical protein